MLQRRFASCFFYTVDQILAEVYFLSFARPSEPGIHPAIEDPWSIGFDQEVLALLDDMEESLTLRF